MCRCRAMVGLNRRLRGGERLLGLAVGEKQASPERKAWVQRQRRRLLKGQTQEVLDEIETVCGPRGGAVLKRERGYFRPEALRTNPASTSSSY